MRIFCPALLTTLLCCACSSERAPSHLTPEQLRAELRLRLEAAAEQGFSGAASITRGGAPLLVEGYGLANRERDLPNSVDTAFDFGSVLKDLTAAAIFKLAGEGQLDVTDPLAAIFDDVPSDKAAITILQLIEHRAGFDEYHDTEGDFEPMTQVEARAKIFAQELLFAPGSEQAYSNSGYTLLADVVQTVSGEEFTRYVRDELLVPAGMRDSGFYGDATWERVDTAIGYGAERFGDNDPADWPYTWSLVGNGGLLATSSDLERWFVALWSGRVLDPAALHAYVEHYLSASAARIAGQTAYFAAGAGDYGLGGFAMHCPEADARIVIGTNSYEDFDIERLGVELSKLVLRAR